MWHTTQLFQMFVLCYSLQYLHGQGKISKIPLFGRQTQTLIDIKSRLYYSNPQICVKFNEQFILKGKEHTFNCCVPPFLPLNIISPVEKHTKQYMQAKPSIYITTVSDLKWLHNINKIDLDVFTRKVKFYIKK